MKRLSRPFFSSLLIALGAWGLPACGGTGTSVPVRVAPPPAPLPGARVQHEVGRLLSADPAESAAAEDRLVQLDEDARGALAALAAELPRERDPRWLHVLEENHLLAGLVPPLTSAQEVDFQVWKVAHRGGVYAMRAQRRLQVLARSEPELLLRRLDRGGPGAEAVAVALAQARELRAVPPLLARYRHARTEAERRIAAEALALFAGEDRRPRVQGTDDEIERDARAIEIWLARAGKTEDDRDA